MARAIIDLNLFTNTYVFCFSTYSGYAKAGQKLFDMATRAWDEGNDPYPIWGTCLGFELLALLAAEGQENLASCLSVDQALALNLTEHFQG